MQHKEYSWGKSVLIISSNACRHYILGPRTASSRSVMPGRTALNHSIMSAGKKGPCTFPVGSIYLQTRPRAHTWLQEQGSHGRQDAIRTV